jgi:hypothetical protein
MVADWINAITTGSQPLVRHGFLHNGSITGFGIIIA